MRKHWKSKVSREGVSPVIATILMVAITVVLAAILMVMVMEMSAEPEPVLNAEAIYTSQDGWVGRVTYASAPLNVDDIGVFVYQGGKYWPVDGYWDSDTIWFGSTFHTIPKALGPTDFPAVNFPADISFHHKGKVLATIVFDFGA